METRRDWRFFLRRNHLARLASVLLLAAGVSEGRLLAQDNCEEFVPGNGMYLPIPIWSGAVVGPASHIACGSQISQGALQTVCAFLDDSGVVTFVPESAAGVAGPAMFSQPQTPIPSGLGTPAFSLKLPIGYIPVAGDGFLRILPTSPDVGTSYPDPLDLRRSDCPSDSLQASPVIQSRAVSNDAFNAAQTDDLIFQITSYGCSTETGNRIYAIRPTDMSIAWTFNDGGFGGSYAVNAGVGCVVDYSRNSLYCATIPTDELTGQPTLFAVDTLNGSLRWSVNVGRIVAPAMGHGGDRLYVAGTSFVGALDPDTGGAIWSADLSAFGLENDVPQALAVTDRPDSPTILLIGGTAGGEGYIQALLDGGTSPMSYWRTKTNDQVLGLVFHRGSGWIYYGDSSGIFQVDTNSGAVNEQASGADILQGWSGDLTLERSVPTGPADRLIAGRTGAVSVSELGIPWAEGWQADTSVSIVGPTEATLGDQVVYSVTVTNAGPAAATDVFLSNIPADFPGAVTFLDYGALSPFGGPGLATGVNLGDLMPGASTTVQVTLSAQNAGPLTLRLLVYSGERDVDPSNNTFCFTTNVASPDTTPPVLTVPGNVTVEAKGPNGANASYVASAKDDQDPNPTVRCMPVSGSLFPLGATTVSCTAKDASGNVATASFVVTVVDTTPPTLTLSPNLTADATSPAGAAVTYTVSASDLVDPKPTVACTPVSGAVFPIGTTTVTCTATDFSKNSSSGTFTVTVNGVLQQIGSAMTRVSALNLLPGLTYSLNTELTLAENAFNAGRKVVACALMEAFVLEVESVPHGLLLAPSAADLLARANRIRAVMGCGG